jgi:hypothetical protein
VPNVPGAVAGLLDGADLESRVGLAFELITAGADGWPRVALLGAGELLAPRHDPTTVLLALWPGSQTTANLERAGRALLAVVHDGAAWRLGLEARRLADLEAPEPRAVFEARLASLQRDEVPYARLVSGISFELPDPGPVVARWRATVDALRALGEAG